MIVCRLQHLASSAEVRRKLQDREQARRELLQDRREGSNVIIGDDDVLFSSGDHL